MKRRKNSNAQLTSKTKSATVYFHKRAHREPQCRKAQLSIVTYWIVPVILITQRNLKQLGTDRTRNIQTYFLNKQNMLFMILRNVYNRGRVGF